MAINPISGSNISYITARPAARAVEPQAAQAYGGFRPDQMQLSSAGATARKAQAAAAQAPELRAERVAGLKAQVQSGAYQVDTTALAQKLLMVL